MAYRNRPAVLEAEGRTGITEEMCNRIMRVIDAATTEALAKEGLEATRFDSARCPEAGWFSVTIKMRPRGA
jgi:hypothetical protein